MTTNIFINGAGRPDSLELYDTFSQRKKEYQPGDVPSQPESSRTSRNDARGQLLIKIRETSWTKG